QGYAAGRLGFISFPNAVWERPSRNSVASRSPDAKQSFADRRSQTEFGNEKSERWQLLGHACGNSGFMAAAPAPRQIVEDATDAALVQAGPRRNLRKRNSLSFEAQ